MHEYNDGTFGPIREADDEFFKELPQIAEQLRAVHFAPTKTLLEKERDRIEQGRAMEARVETLEDRISALEDDPNSLIHKPSKKEQMEILRAQAKRLRP